VPPIWWTRFCRACRYGNGVLTVPYRLRYQIAWNHGLSRAVLRVYTRVLLDAYARGARVSGIAGGQTRTVTALQRAGGALNTNLHFGRPPPEGVHADYVCARRTERTMNVSQRSRSSTILAISFA
jgi:hypothetical protein